MKIFGWMKSKLHGKDNTIKPESESTLCDTMHQDRKQEISGCPNALLAIGTFGSNLKHSNEEEEVGSSFPRELEKFFDSFPEDEEITHESISDAILQRKTSANSNLSIEEFFDCIPEDEKIANEFISDAILQRRTSAVHTRGKKHIPSNKIKTGLYKKSLSFLLKKALLCGGGFVPRPIITPIFKYPFPDPNLDNLTTDKMTGAMIRKKKYPRRQKYLDMSKTGFETHREAGSGNNWVNTDSEYIVLEL